MIQWDLKMMHWIAGRTTRMLAVLTLTSLCAACSSKGPPSSSQPSSSLPPANAKVGEGFPLKAGSYWVYKGTVKWQDGTEAKETSVAWRMEVIRSERVGKYEVTFLEGHPEDLAWFTPGKPRGIHVFVNDGGRYYELGSVTDPGSLLADEATLESHLQPESVFLELPLNKGMCLGRAPDIQRDDNMYCWSVGAPTSYAPQGVTGIPSGNPFFDYELSFRSLPDHTMIHFVPGIGITSFVYGHHGTLSEADVHLIEYHPG